VFRERDLDRGMADVQRAAVLRHHRRDRRRLTVEQLPPLEQLQTWSAGQLVPALVAGTRHLRALRPKKSQESIPLHETVLGIPRAPGKMQGQSGSRLDPGIKAPS